MARTANRFNAINMKQTLITGNTYKVALYARISLDINYKPSESIENQIEMMRQYILKNPQFANYQIYVDRGYSGMNYNRPDFIRMMNDIRMGKVNCVIVKDMSRFGRDYLETGNYLEIVFPFLGVRFISINDNYDTDKEINGNKALEVAITNLVNDTYARNVSRNVGISRKIEINKGKFTGSNAPYGYKVDNTNPLRKYIIDEGPAGVVKDIFIMASEGRTLRDISKELQSRNLTIPGKYIENGHLYQQDGDEKKIWYIGTLSNILCNQAYIGNMVQGKSKTSLYDNEKKHTTTRDEWVVVENIHEPIISKDIFEKVRKIFDKKLDSSTFIKNEKVESKTDKYKDILFCGKCGNKLHLLSTIKAGKREYRYQCHKGYELGTEKSCNVYIKEQDLDEKVFDCINKKIKETFGKCEDAIQLVRMKLNKDLKMLEEKIKNTTQQINKENQRGSWLYSRYVDGSVDSESYKNQRDATESFIEDLKERLSQQKKEYQNKAAEIEKSLEWIKTIYEVTLEASNREMLLKIVSKINLFPQKEIYIEWKLDSDIIQVISEWCTKKH